MHRPADPEARPEAVALLDRLHSLRGRCLTGQHNQLFHMSEPSDRIEVLTGKRPLIWGGEWGFSDSSYPVDDVAKRPELLDQIRRHHAAGGIACLTWHQAPPTLGEPCRFNPGVISNLTDDEWDRVLDPAGDLHARWAEMVDRLAEGLITLQSEGIPLIFRPYHEMNGGWFWWGGDPKRFLPLWRMLWDRLTGHWGVHNLLWAWNPDKPWPGVEDYYPGEGSADLIGADIYPRGEGEPTYPQEWYDRMKGIAGDRILALSEMSELPTPELLEAQPWDYFMAWDNLVFRANDERRIREVYAHERFLSRG